MSDDEPMGVRDRMDVVVSAETAASAYPSPPENRRRDDQRQPISWESLEVLPDAFIEPIRQRAEQAKVWCYLLPGDRVGVEVLNAPLRKHHKALRVPAENRA